MVDEHENAALFLHSAIRELGGFDNPISTRVLDFGCGSGKLVRKFITLGYDASGCDVKPYWECSTESELNKLEMIAKEPYRLPFDDGTFDVVVSTSVLEHAQNTEEIFREIKRVLRIKGYSMHLYPGKWYLPTEPHIYVPLVNYFWPNCPSWWLLLWALLGIRNEHQENQAWKDVARDNLEYCRHGLCYRSNGYYREVSNAIFGNYSAPMEFYIVNGYGGVANLLRKLPFKALTGWLAGEVRMNFIVQQKSTT